MKHLYADSRVAQLALRYAYSNASSRTQWAADRATGASIPSATAGVNLDLLLGLHHPNLQKKVTNRLEAAGFLPSQCEDMWSFAHDAVTHLYADLCRFQQEHRQSLGRRSGEYFPWETSQAIKHNAQALGNKVKALVAPTQTVDQHFRAEINQRIWNAQAPESPFNQAVVQQLVHFMEGLCRYWTAQLDQDQADVRFFPTDTNGEAEICIEDLIDCARQGSPELARQMPFWGHEGGESRLSLRLAKQQLTTMVVDKAQCISQSKAQETAEKIAPLIDAANQKILTLVRYTQSTLAEHTSVCGDGDVLKIKTSTGLDPTEYLIQQVREIVSELSKNVRRVSGPYPGLTPDQVFIRDLQIAAGIDLPESIMLGTQWAVNSALSFLSVGVSAAALSEPAGAALAGLVNAARTVVTMAASAGVHAHAGGVWAGDHEAGMRGWPGNISQRENNAESKNLQYDTSKIVQRLGQKIQWKDLRQTVSDLMPAVQSQFNQSQRLWASVRAEDVKHCTDFVSQLVQHLPAWEKLPNLPKLPELLSNASLADATDPKRLAHLVNALANTCPPAGNVAADGHAAIAAWGSYMSQQLERQYEQSNDPEYYKLAVQLLDTPTDVSVNASDLMSPHAAAEYVLLNEPIAKNRMAQHCSAMMQGTSVDATEEAFTHASWSNLVAGLVWGLASGVVVGATAAGVGAVAGAVAGAAIGATVGLVSTGLTSEARRWQNSDQHVRGMQEAARRGTVAPFVNPYLRQASVAEMANHIEQQSSVHTNLLALQTDALMDHLAQNAMTKTVEKSAVLGRTLLACLSEHVEDTDCAELLHAFDLAANRRHDVLNRVNANALRQHTLNASKEKLETALKQLDPGSDAAQWATKKFSSLKTVKNIQADSVKNASQETYWEKQKEEKLNQLKERIPLLFERVGIAQLSEKDWTHLESFLMYPDGCLNAQVVEACRAIKQHIHVVSEAPDLANCLKDRWYTDSRRLTSYLKTTQTQLDRLKADLESLDHDACCLQQGRYKDVKDPYGLLHKWSNGYDARSVVRTTHDINSQYLSNRMTAFTLGSMTIGTGIGMGMIGGGVASAFVPPVHASGTSFAMNPASIALGRLAATSFSPRSASRGGRAIAAQQTEGPDETFKATMQLQSARIHRKSDGWMGVKFDSSKKRLSAQRDGTLPYVQQIGPGRRLGVPLKALGLPVSQSLQIFKNTASADSTKFLKPLVQASSWRAVGQHLLSDARSHRNTAVRHMTADLVIQSKTLALVQDALNRTQNRSSN